MTRSGTGTLNDGLVDGLVGAGHVRSEDLEAAFRAVPRHLFLPGVAIDEAYRDEVVFTKQIGGRSVSACPQPAVVAAMLEQLGLQRGERVLEIGAGTGYGAAIMARLVGPEGRVVTVDVDDDITTGAQDNLRSARVSGVEVVCADGARGHASGAPYDAIVLTVGAADVLPAWRDQLRPGGRLLIPLSIRGVQSSILFVKDRDCLRSLSVRPCRFVMLRGALADTGHELELGPGRVLWTEDAASIDADALRGALEGPVPEAVATALRGSPREFFVALRLWLALRLPDFCALSADGPDVDDARLPRLLSIPGKFATTAGTARGAGMCLLHVARDGDESSWPPNNEDGDLCTRSYGDAGDMSELVDDEVEEWDAHDRPGLDALRIVAYADERRSGAAGEYVHDTLNTTLSIDWTR